MKQMLAALGLPETADEAAALAASERPATGTGRRCGPCRGRARSARFVAMSTFSAVQQEAAQLREELEKLRAEARAAALKDDIEAALKDGRLTAATKAWAEELARTSPEALKAYLAAQPPVQALTRTQTGGTPPADGTDTAGLTDEERHICASLGLTLEEFAQAREEK